MTRYMVPVETTRVALKKLTGIVSSLKLTELQEKFAVHTGCSSWKELINVNKNNAVSTWITMPKFYGLIEKSMARTLII